MQYFFKHNFYCSERCTRFGNTDMRILYNFKGYLRKSEQIVGTSLNIPEFDSHTILSKKIGAKCDLGSEEKCTITKLLAIGRSTSEIAKHLGRDHLTVKKYI